jgi:hypothetical protein
MLLGVLIFLGIVLLAAVAFWIVYGIKKYNWAMIASIVVTSMFVIMLGMSGIRLIAKTAAVGSLPFHDKVESIAENRDLGPGNKKGLFMEGKKSILRDNKKAFKDFCPDTQPDLEEELGQ